MRAGIQAVRERSGARGALLKSRNSQVLKRTVNIAQSMIEVGEEKVYLASETHPARVDMNVSARTRVFYNLHGGWGLRQKRGEDMIMKTLTQ